MADAVAERSKPGVREGARRAKEVSPEGYLVGLGMVLVWIFLPKYIWEVHGVAWALLTMAALAGLLFGWGWVERRIEPRLQQRRRGRAATRQQRGKGFASLPWPRKIVRCLALAVVIPFVVVAAIAWYGALLVAPTILLAIGTFAVGIHVAWALLGIPLGVLAVGAWIRYATPEVVTAANVGALAAAAV